MSIEPHDDVWLVSLKTDDQHIVTMRTYRELPEAIEAVHEWMLMLSDETEIRLDSDATRDATARVLETMARIALGEDIGTPKTIEETLTRDELRTWFEREMEQ